jgi:hypothetical protein
VADDLFANRLFGPAERCLAQDATFVVRPPRTLRSLLNIRTRAYTGNLEYARAVQSGEVQGTGTNGIRLRSYLPALNSPRMWPALAVFLTVTATAKVRAHWRHSVARSNRWDRDETARTA